MYDGESRTSIWRRKKGIGGMGHQKNPFKGFDASVKAMQAAYACAVKAAKQIGYPEHMVEDAAQEILIAWAHNSSWLTGAKKVQPSDAKNKLVEFQKFGLTEKEILVGIDLRMEGINSLEDVETMVGL